MKEGAVMGASPAEVVAKCDITFAMLADPEAALQASGGGACDLGCMRAGHAGHHQLLHGGLGGLHRPCARLPWPSGVLVAHTSTKGKPAAVRLFHGCPCACVLLRWCSVTRVCCRAWQQVSPALSHMFRPARPASVDKAGWGAGSEVYSFTCSMPCKGRHAAKL